jgi:hypothetical protein
MRRLQKRMFRRMSEFVSNRYPNKTASMLTKCGFIRQLERTEMKFFRRVIVYRCDCRRFDERKQGMREFLPDGEIIRCDREPPEPEHIASRLGYVSDLMPSDLIDRQLCRLRASWRIDSRFEASVVD